MMKTYIKSAVISCLVLSGATTAYANDDDKTTVQDADAKWDVTNPNFKTDKKEAVLDVTEGTWMSLDVSPDGTMIAFDLLGDIYTLPITGGTATNISAGVSWDMQPRWSPDGTKIAFTSDRKGGDNIWIMNADGSDPKQITKETFRLMNNPTWSPDGTMIAAKKHFTTSRSLGTGEIWLYHVDGGNGLQVVKRPSEAHQKELGEPVFAPDGKSIYYTQNITSGPIFEYEQDTNQEVFRIRSIDLTTGDVTDIAGGEGGAVTATPSPDGKSIAFVRRVRAKSRLFIRDLATGKERMIYDALDQDMQETWAVQGVYPNMAWTPDNTHVVFWTNGKINKINVQSGEKSIIPFHVKDTRTLYKAPHYTVDVAADTFDTKMIRWPSYSPDGTSVVFESLGSLWIKKGDNAPSRLTKDDTGEFELYPTWSPDGKWVYFMSWDDQNLSTLRRVKSKGGKSEILNTEKGHYFDLTVSPDSKTLVYTKGSGGGLVSPDYGTKPGIYSMPTMGGKPTFITRRGSNAHFGPSSDRLYLNLSINNKQTLVSMDMDGEKIRHHAQGADVRDITISPKGKYVSFVQNYEAYIAPLTNIGKAVELDAKGNAFPLKKVSKNGATFPTWAADGSALNWVVGPTMKTVQLSAVFKDDFKPIETGISLSMPVQTEAPKGLIAITGARVITMNANEDVIDNAVIIIENNRIKEIGAASDIAIPTNAKIVDMTGKTITPGFIDMHAHATYSTNMIVPQQNWMNHATLALGVTTVHDPSSGATGVFAASEYNRAGKVLTPRIFSTAEVVYGAKALGFWASVDSMEDALAHVRRLKAQGAISVKNYNQPRRDQRQQVTEAARREGLNVVVEGGSLYHMDMNMVVDGNTGIEHTLPNQEIYDDVVQLWAQSNVGLTPTLVVGYGGVRGEHYWYQETEVWKHPILSQYVPPKTLQARSVRRQKAPDSDYGYVENAALAKKLADKGVDINIGAHGQREGLGAHWEIWMFQQGGMSEMEALKTATSSPAHYMGFDKDIGSLEVGKLADLIVMDANPLENIRNTDKISHVMLNGRLYESGTLNEVVTGTRKNKPFYWQGKPESDIR